MKPCANFSRQTILHARLNSLSSSLQPQPNDLGFCSYDPEELHKCVDRLRDHDRIDFPSRRQVMTRALKIQQRGTGWNQLQSSLHLLGRGERVAGAVNEQSIRLETWKVLRTKSGVFPGRV